MNYFNYFTEIEDTFIRRRGKHLLVSPMDWAMIESWLQLGIPLHVVLRGIETAFDAYEKKPRHRTVKSLMYCREEIEAQFAEWKQSQVGGHDSENDRTNLDGAPSDSSLIPHPSSLPSLPYPREVICAHLADARAMLVNLRGSVIESGPLHESLSRAISRLDEIERDFSVAASPDAHALDDSLTALEKILDQAIEKDIDEDELERIEAEATKQLKTYRSHMEPEIYQQTLRNFLLKRLRERYNLPRLSLFYL